jgi:hypothetical protein
VLAVATAIAAALTMLTAPAPTTPAAAQEDPTLTPPARVIETPDLALQYEWNAEGEVTDTFNGSDGVVCLVTDGTTITCYEADGTVRGGPYQPNPDSWVIEQAWPVTQITSNMDMWTWNAARSADGAAALTLTTLDGEFLAGVDLPAEIVSRDGELWGAVGPDGTVVVGTRGGDRFGILRPDSYSVSDSSGGEPTESLSLNVIAVDFQVRTAAFDADGTLYVIDENGQLYYARGEDINRPEFGGGFTPFAEPLPDDQIFFTRPSGSGLIGGWDDDLLLVTVASGDVNSDSTALAVFRIGGGGRLPGLEPLSMLQFEIQIGTSKGGGGSMIVKPSPDGLIIFVGSFGGIYQIDHEPKSGPVLVLDLSSQPDDVPLFTEVSGLNHEIAVISRTADASRVQIYSTP